MKKCVLILVLAIVFCGCGSFDDDIDAAMRLRSDIIKADGCTIHATVTADYLENASQFSLACDFDKQGNMTFRVLRPETLAEITGTVTSAGGAITFDDQVLAFPLLAEGMISPISAPWVLMKSLRGGYIHACGKEQEGYTIILNDSYEEDALEVIVNTDMHGSPVFAEIIWQGRRVVSIQVDSFSYV